MRSSIAYLHRKSIELYPGNYSKFEIIKAERLAGIQRNYEKQQKEVAHMQKFITRFKAKATKARQAQSRVKALERMQLIAPAHIDSPFSFVIPETEKISNPLVALDDADLGYDSVILEKVNLSICPTDRIGLLGPNGAGKSTLIKSLVGDLEIIDGERNEGKNLRVGYFSQYQVDDLDLSMTAFNHIQRLDQTKSEKQIRTYLGGFDFKGDKVNDSIHLFSGGEKARLAFAIIAYQKPNVLLMDEPTNHLDMEMRHALTVALQTFKGAILLVSHDRHLLSSTVDTFYMVDKGQVSVFDGDLDDYKNYILNGTISNYKAKTKIENKSINHENIKKTKKLKSEISSIEKRLTRLNRKLLKANEDLADPELYNSDIKPDIQNLIKTQLELTSEIEIAEKEWLIASSQIDKSSS